MAFTCFVGRSVRDSDRRFFEDAAGGPERCRNATLVDQIATVVLTAERRGVFHSPFEERCSRQSGNLTAVNSAERGGGQAR